MTTDNARIPKVRIGFGSVSGFRIISSLSNFFFLPLQSKVSFMTSLQTETNFRLFVVCAVVVVAEEDEDGGEEMAQPQEQRRAVLPFRLHQ